MPLPFVDFWKMRMMSWNQHGRHVTVKLRDDREMEARLWILTATHDVMRDDESMWGCPCLSYIIMVSERSLLLAICMPTAAPHIPIASNCIQLHPSAGWSSFICRLIELKWRYWVATFKGTFGVGTCGWYPSIEYWKMRVTWQPCGQGPIWRAWPIVHQSRIIANQCGESKILTTTDYCVEVVI